MERRLVKIAKELNVGLSTIVDFLTDKGYDIDNKPTAKVSEDMYNELLKEFAKSLDIKNRADQLVIGTRPSGNKKEEEAASSSGLKELSPKTRVSLGGSKPSISLSPKKEAPKPEPPKEEPAPAPEPEPQPVAKEEEKAAPPASEVTEAPPQAEPEPTKAEAPAVKPEEKPEAPKAEEKPAPAAEEKPKAGGLKVLGKIDLDSTDRKTGKPKKKKAEPTPKEEQPKAEEKPTPAKEPEKPAPAAEPVKAKQDKPAEAKPEKAEDQDAKKAEDKPAAAKKAEASSDTDEKPKEGSEEMVRAKTPELRGLKILGKIDTSKLGSRGRGGKKDSKAKTENKTSSSSTSGDSGERKRRKRKRKKITADTAGNRGGRQGGRAGGGRGKSGQDEPREVSKKEIEDKIKATMARMAGKGKKKRQRIRRDNRERMREKQEAREMEGQSDKLEVTEFISVQELANLMDVPAADVIMTCMNLGVIVSINQRLEADVIELVAEEYGHEIEFISVEEELDEEEEYVDDPADLEPRAPIVTIMGHVDHGKTSLLDYIRSATVADGEAGGITQHIGAYEVNVEGDKNKRVTFLDTPGHEAFTAMRARGAKVTDIAVIIIAADDSIMPQTKEAISHAEAAGVPIIFAINKIDKPGANPEKIKQDLASLNYLVEDWGGAYGSADISAKTGDGVDTLLERILLEAEMKELKANPDRPAVGAILEASLEKGRGYVAKMLIQAGTLRVGDSMVSGEHSGRVKAMFNERNKRVKEAGPSKPVLVLGLGGAPQAGERVKVVDSEQEAREIANRRAQISREQANRATKRISLDEIGRRLALGNFKELNLIVKGDVDGSVEALSDSLIKLSQETVQVNVIHRAVGQIVESDVLLATASDAIIVGFQVRPSANARKLAEREGVQIKTYSIIYEAIEEIKLAIEGMLDTIKEENVLGSIEVREVFKISKVGTVAGCYVTEGKVLRDSHVRLIREGIVIYPTKEGQVGEINALKRFKDDVKEVRAGMECGISVKNYNDIKVGDVIEAYEIVETKQTISL